MTEWHAHMNGSMYARFCARAHGRPVVVIDPEDAQQVNLLSLAYTAEDPAADVPVRMQAALREFAAPTPPKPEEPQGLGAVVEDDTGRQWVRVERARLPWLTEVDGSFLNLRWNEVSAVRVLSEGVTS